jgi:hypothetical protein
MTTTTQTGQTEQRIAELNRQIAETVHESTLVLETENERRNLQNPDFRHGFAHNVLKNSFNQAFYFGYNNQIPTPPVGPAFRFLNADGTEYMTVQWGVTHPDIQAEIEAEWDVDCD